MYRPPNQMPSEFVSGFNNVLSKISKENKLCYILSDTNLNLINHDCHQPTIEFLDLLCSYMFYPLITCPTRITSHSATLIDNIFTNNLDNDAFNGLFSPTSQIICLFFPFPAASVMLQLTLPRLLSVTKVQATF